MSTRINNNLNLLDARKRHTNNEIHGGIQLCHFVLTKTLLLFQPILT